MAHRPYILLMPHAPRPTPHAPCPTPHHAPCPMRHVPCAMSHAPCPMRHALCPMPHAPCPTPDAQVGAVWKKSSQRGLLAKRTSAVVGAEQQRTEKAAAFDLLDGLSRSGSLSIECASLHVIVCATHCFDASLIDTVVVKNGPPSAPPRPHRRPNLARSPRSIVWSSRMPPYPLAATFARSCPRWLLGDCTRLTSHPSARARSQPNREARALLADHC